MLRENNILSNAKWVDVSKILSRDPRWGVLHATGDKRQAFAE